MTAEAVAVEAPSITGLSVTGPVAVGRTFAVHAARDEALHRPCVVKTIRPDSSGDAKAVARLLREGRTLQQLAHPGLVRCYEVRPAPEPVIVLETLTGHTLGRLLDTRRYGLSGADLVELGLQLVDVLGHLHVNGILHLDLKASNLVLGGGRVTVLDLGIARPPGACPAGTGTAGYMPPEQITGGRVGPASDVYGLGGVLYRAATRRRPFGADDRTRSPGRRAPFARLRRRNLPRPLTGLIETALEPEPADRPSLAEAAQTLEALRPGAVPQ